MMRSTVYDVFIACRPRDMEAVRPLRDALRDRKLVVFVDHESIEPGDPIDLVAEYHKACPLTLVFIVGDGADGRAMLDERQREAVDRAVLYCEEQGVHRLVAIYHDVEQVPRAVREQAPALTRTEPVFFPIARTWQRVADRLCSGRPADEGAFDGRRLELARQANDLLRRGEDPAPVASVIARLKDERRAHSALASGRVIGDRGEFTIDERITHGPLCTVWRVQRRDTGEFCAIKVLHPGWSADPDKRRRFERGVRVLLRHAGEPGGGQHIVRVLQGVTFDAALGVYYFVMPLHDCTLRQAVEDKQVEPHQAGEVVAQIGMALALLHRNGIVHQDVKPDNILLAGSAHVPGSGPSVPTFLLADFGSVSVLASASKVVPLTLLYSAPELLDGGQDVARPPSDIYSLARTALFVLNGGELPLEVLRDPRGFVAGEMRLGVDLTRVLCDALEWDPTRRPFESMDDFIAEFRRALAAADLDSDAAAAWRRERARYRAAVALVLACQRGPDSTATLDRMEYARALPFAARLARDEQLRVGRPSVADIFARSRRRLRWRRTLDVATLALIGVGLAVTARYALLMADNRGLFDLEVAAFDLDAAGQPIPLGPGSLPDLALRLFAVGAPDALAPGDAVPTGRYDVEVLPTGPGAVHRLRIDAPGGRYALALFNRHAAGEQPCAASIVWEVELPGFSERSSFGTPPLKALMIPSCQASRAGRVSIPAGPVRLGHAENLRLSRGVDRPNAYGPRTAVLRAFAVDRWETSNADYGRFVDGVASLARPPSPRRTPVAEPRRNHPNAGQPSHPVSYVSWHDARDYCHWQGKSLLTFAQFQRVGRGLASADNPAPGRLYPWGDVPPDDENELAQTRTQGYLYRAGIISTAPVRSETAEGPLPAPHDVRHLVGNAGLWLADGESSDAIPVEGQSNPFGALAAEQRMFHAGHWILPTYPELLHLSYADVAVPGNRLAEVGIRCAWWEPEPGRGR